MRLRRSRRWPVHRRQCRRRRRCALLRVLRRRRLYLPLLYDLVCRLDQCLLFRCGRVDYRRSRVFVRRYLGRCPLFHRYLFTRLSRYSHCPLEALPLCPLYWVFLL